jgi:acyl-CoA thioesterase-1
MIRALFLVVALAASPSALAAKKLVLLGDSLTEGYGVAREKSYAYLLQQKFGAQVQIVNASISGSTSASAPSRMKWQMKEKPDALLLALGANDGLRGLPVKTLEDNLSQAIEIAQKEGVKVILGGMYLPPNYGADYGQKFKEVFKRLASKYKTPFIPFMLEGVAGHPEFNQADGIHPNEKGQAMVAETVYKALKAIL